MTASQGRPASKFSCVRFLYVYTLKFQFYWTKVHLSKTFLSFVNLLMKSCSLQFDILFVSQAASETKCLWVQSDSLLLWKTEIKWHSLFLPHSSLRCKEGHLEVCVLSKSLRISYSSFFLGTHLPCVLAAVLRGNSQKRWGQPGELWRPNFSKRSLLFLSWWIL